MKPPGSRKSTCGSAPRHLIALGHRRIAMIAGHDRILCCRARLDGYRSALEAAGLRVDSDLVVHAELARHDGRVAALRLPHGPERPTAIFEAGAGSPTFVGGVAVADVLLAASVTAVIACNDVIAPAGLTGRETHGFTPLTRWDQPLSGGGNR
ncbi:substrate-binding domain-containing protein [Sphaerisporangium rhizosphaerae]|uniref:Substrate-binding domain-containing protein n=1 Tax=Sphaerisporangium rhizosphaerae TaxID=2269375 RepID=A0ABW2P7B6_9ACTN